ncbi:hypothetical protein EJB05_28193, partial [Eragrostis curvula]
TEAGLEDVEIVAEETGADLNVLECANHQPQGKPRHGRRVTELHIIVDSSLLGTEAGLEDVEIVAEETGADLNVLENVLAQENEAHLRAECASL